jgi:hypothetical protein
MRLKLGGIMGDQLYLERFVWFDNEARRERFPNASKLGEHFEIAPKTAQRSIDHFRDRLQAPLEYDQSHKGYFYTDPTFQLPVIRISEEELLALLISRKLITEASAGSLADELGSVSMRLGSLLAANLPGKANPEEAFSFRWKNISPTDPQIFKIVTSALLQGKLLTFCYYSPTSSNCTMRTVPGVNIILHIVAGVVGNYLYYGQVKQKILEIRAIPAHQNINLVYQEVGGVHRWVIIVGILFSIMLAFLFAIFFSTMIAFMGNHMDKISI